MSRVISFLVLVVLLIGTPATGGTVETLADALAAHQAAVEAIDTIYLQFEINTDLQEQRLASFAPPGKIVGEYWRDRGTERIYYSGPSGKETVYRTSQTVTVVGDLIDPKTNSKHQTGSIIPAGSPVFLRVVPWRLALFSLDSNRGSGSMTLSEQLSWLPGKPTYKVVDSLGIITCANGAVTFQLDPTHNYLIRSRRTFQDGVTNPKKGKVRMEINEEVLDYSEVSPGIYFPKEVVIEQKLADNLEYKKTVTFSSIKVNAPVDPELFKPKYQDGTLVRDEVRSTEYRVNASGERQGPETDIAKMAVAPGPSPVEDDPLRSSSQPTIEEQSRWGWWLAPTGGALILCGLGVAIWRRKRNAD
jgi:outer membrane lipoprotein-sorting protein